MIYDISAMIIHRIELLTYHQVCFKFDIKFVLSLSNHYWTILCSAIKTELMTIENACFNTYFCQVSAAVQL